MTSRRVLTALLLVFVAAGVVTLLGKEFRSRPASVGPPAGEFRDGCTIGTRVVAYYFVGKVRCSSCRKIEDVSRKTIEASFPHELSRDRLRFLVVDIDRPENRHFIDDYRLDSSSLVLVALRDGRPSGWKNLRDVWSLVEDGERLAEYVRGEVAAKLKTL